MATATSIPPPPPIPPPTPASRVHLDLSSEEAQLVLDTIYQSAGSPTLSRRKYAHQVILSMRGIGMEPDTSGRNRSPKDFDLENSTRGSIYWKDTL